MGICARRCVSPRTAHVSEKRSCIMRNLKKYASLLIAVCLLLSLCTFTAQADGADDTPAVLVCAGPSADTRLPGDCLVLSESRTFYLVEASGRLFTENGVEVGMAKNTSGVDFAPDIQIASDGSYALITIPDDAPYFSTALFGFYAFFRDGTIGYPAIMIYAENYALFRGIEYDGSGFYLSNNTTKDFNDLTSGNQRLGVFCFGNASVSEPLDVLSVQFIPDDSASEGAVNVMARVRFGSTIYGSVIDAMHPGSGVIRVTTTENEVYEFPTTVSLPVFGFYSSTTASGDTFLDSFACTDTSRTFYAVNTNDLPITDFTLFYGADLVTCRKISDHVLELTVKDGALLSENAEIRLEVELGGTIYRNAYIPLLDAAPGFYYSEVYWNADETYEVQPYRLRSLSLAPGYGTNALFFMGNADGSSTQIFPTDVRFVADAGTTEDALRILEPMSEDDTYTFIGNGLGGGTILVTADGYDTPFEIPFTAPLPELGCYSENRAAADTLLDEFTFTDTNKSFYVIYTGEGSDYTFVLGTGSKYAQITEQGEGYAVVTIRDDIIPEDWMELEIRLMYGSSRGPSTYIPLMDGTSRLLFMNGWCDKNSGDYQFDFPSYSFRLVPERDVSGFFMFGNDKETVLYPDSIEYIPDADTDPDAFAVYYDEESGCIDIFADTFGSGVIRITLGGETYDIPAVCTLPEIGFYTSSTPSFDTYLTNDEFEYTETNRSFYAVYLGEEPLTGISVISGSEYVKSIDFTPGDNYARITLADDLPESEYGWLSMRVRFSTEGGSSSTEILLIDMTSHTFFRWGTPDDGDWSNYGVSNSIELTPAYGCSGGFFYGTPAESVHLIPDEIEFISDETGEPSNKITITALDYCYGAYSIEPRGLDSGVIRLTVGENVYDLPIRVVLPEIGFYSENRAAEDTMLSEFTYTADCKSIYAIYTGSETVTGFELFNGNQYVEITEQGENYAVLTVKDDIIPADLMQIVLCVNINDGSLNTAYINLYDGMDRIFLLDGSYEVSSATFEFYGRPYYSFNMMPGECACGFFVSGNLQNKVEIDPDRIEYIPDPGTDPDAFEVEYTDDTPIYVWITCNTFGSGVIRLTLDGGEIYDIPAVCTLPEFGFYSESTPSVDAYLGWDFEYTETVRSFYAVYTGEDAVYDIFVPDSAEEYVTVDYTPGSKYARITVKDGVTPQEYNSINIPVYFESEHGGGSASINLIDMTSHPFFSTGMPMDWELNGVQPETFMMTTLQQPTSVGFFFGNRDDYVQLFPYQFEFISDETGEPSDILTVTEDGLFHGLYRLTFDKIDSGVLRITAGSDTYDFRVSVVLPEIGIYTTPYADGDRYVTEMEYTGKDVTYYIVNPDMQFTRFIADPYSDFPDYISIDFTPGNNYAAITIHASDEIPEYSDLGFYFEYSDGWGNYFYPTLLDRAMRLKFFNADRGGFDELEWYFNNYAECEISNEVFFDNTGVFAVTNGLTAEYIDFEDLSFPDFVHAHDLGNGIVKMSFMRPGSGEITCTVDGTEYAIPVTVRAPELAFYTDSSGSDSGYLPYNFIFNDTNRTFYCVYKGETEISSLILSHGNDSVDFSYVPGSNYATLTVKDSVTEPVYAIFVYPEYAEPVEGGYPEATITLQPEHVHALEHIDAHTPTCTENGNLEFWRCSECGLLFADAEATMPITINEIDLPGAHRFEIISEKDYVYRHSKCAGCGSENLEIFCEPYEDEEINGGFERFEHGFVRCEANADASAVTVKAYTSEQPLTAIFAEYDEDGRFVRAVFLDLEAGYTETTVKTSADADSFALMLTDETGRAPICAKIESN